jgi:hypothetical protein
MHRGAPSLRVRLAAHLLALAAASVGSACTCSATCGLGGSAVDGGPSSDAMPGGSTVVVDASSTVRLIEREHSSGRCPDPPERSLVGTSAVGAACTAARECAPICCACASSPVHWLAAGCVDGVCAGAEGACAEPSSSGFCDEPHKTSTSTEHSNYQCVPGGGTKKPGEACEKASECTSTCCPCAGARSWSAAACVNGACAGRGTTCAVALKGDDYCGPAPAQSSRSVRGEQESARCPASPRELVGTKKAGQSCDSHADCLPSCCDCAASGASWLASACIDGRCSTTSVACLETENDKLYCGGHCGGEKAPCWRDDTCCSGSCAEHRCR